MIIDLPIAKLGHPVLRLVAQPVTDITDALIQQLIDDMLTTVATLNGVGIAAPQVHHSKRIFIMCSRPSVRYPDAPEMPPIAMINPQLISHGIEQSKDWEGCLSVPALRGLIPRYDSIEVSYLDRNGLPHHSKFNGFVARIFQHELDHLDGITFVDRLESTKDLYSESEWARQFVDEPA
jgi:peptide deformylase